jgi:hypothetical protein
MGTPTHGMKECVKEGNWVEVELYFLNPSGGALLCLKIIYMLMENQLKNSEGTVKHMDRSAIIIHRTVAYSKPHTTPVCSSTCMSHQLRQG